MLEFLKAMLSSEHVVSHRRVISVCSFILIVVLVICALFGVAYDTEILWAMITLCAGASGLTLIHPKNQQL